MDEVISSIQKVTRGLFYTIVSLVITIWKVLELFYNFILWVNKKLVWTRGFLYTFLCIKLVSLLILLANHQELPELVQETMNNNYMFGILLWVLLIFYFEFKSVVEDIKLRKI